MNIALWETKRIFLTFPQVREEKREAKITKNKGRQHGVCGRKRKENLGRSDTELSC